MKSALLLFGSTLAVWGGLPPAAQAQTTRDKVTLLNEDNGSRVRVVCTVLSYTGEYIRFQTRDEGPTTIKSSSEVISIETAQVQAHAEGLEKFAAGDTEAAVKLFEEALKQEPRDWVRRDILAMLVKCALRQNNYAQAGERFLMIYDSDKTTLHFNHIPLVWTTSPPDAQLKAAALQWQERKTPAAKLLAASGLLFDPKYQSSAAIDLRQFHTNADPRIRHLAIAQLWRLDLQSGKVESQTLDRWQDMVRAMPPKLRGGAYFVIGEGRRQRRQYDRAAASLLWVPLVFDHDYQLSALACLDAAESLKAIGQQTEAVMLYREVAERYGRSSYALDARQMLESLRSTPSSSISIESSQTP